MTSKAREDRQREEAENKSQTDVVKDKKVLRNNFVSRIYSHKGLAYIAAGNLLLAIARVYSICKGVW
jgi:hypothetical protein